ncbi:DUF4097 domain-containing protein [Actinomadura adrarensis]|uniref:DUF4097 domain-containing protein n=1 Tax=Actinomadura adrarensis TaxID=1819600 RepID=A0ABW3CLS5_9ACTN
MPVFDTPEPIFADIEMYTGQIRVHASERADTVVEVRPTDPSVDASVQAAERTVVEFSAGRLLVKGPKPNFLGQLRNWRGSIDVTIELPAGSRVEAEVYAEFIGTGRLGQTAVRSLFGDVRLEETGAFESKASTGDIIVDRVTGPAEVSTSTGSIRVGTIDGPGSLKASTGGVTVGEVTGELQLKTGTGNVEVDRALGDLTVRTAHGRIRINHAVSGTVRLENGHGKVSVGIPEGTAAWLDVNSKNGVVRNTMTAAEGPETADRVVEVHANTNWADIDIHRS